MMSLARVNAPKMRWSRGRSYQSVHTNKYIYITFARAILKTQFILWLPCFLAWLHAMIPLCGKPSSVFHTAGSIQPGIGGSYLRHRERKKRQIFQFYVMQYVGCIRPVGMSFV